MSRSHETFDIVFRCGLLFYPYYEAMREALLQDKADIVPTPFFLLTAVVWESSWQKNINYMDFLNILWLVTLFVGVPLYFFFFQRKNGKDEGDSSDVYGCAVIIAIIIIVTIIIVINTR